MPDKDRQIIRDLAKRLAELAGDPAEETKIAQWRRHNGLKGGKAMVLVYPEDVWDEFLPKGTMQCEGESARVFEWALRSRLYLAENIHDARPGSAEWEISLHHSDPGNGIAWNYGRHDVDGRRRTEAFEPVIKDDADPADHVHMRTVSVDHDATQEELESISELFGDILDVRKRGIRGFGFAGRL